MAPARTGLADVFGAMNGHYPEPPEIQSASPQLSGEVLAGDGAFGMTASG